MHFCGQCGASLQSKTIVRERRQVSVVFIDLSGFTTLTHGFDPEKLRDLADEILTVVAGIIEDYDGYVDAFQGDGLIALFGAPHSHPDDPHRAVQAAIAGLRAIESIGESKGYALKGRAGVNTGIVIAGSVGSGRVREYTVMGSAVNLAARLEAAATPGEVWVGPETYAATQHRMHYEAVEPVQLAGFPDVTTVYKLIKIYQSSDADPYINLRFVGREAELSMLKQAYQNLQRRTKSLWLVGEAGSGKTRLVREFSRELESQHAKIVWLQEYSHHPKAIWLQLAQQLFGQIEEDERLWRQAIARRLETLLPGESRWHNAILGSLGMGSSRPWRRLERRTVDRIFLAWRDLFKAYLQRHSEHGTLLVIEHGSQGTSLGQFLDLLEDLELPLLIVRTSRGRDIPAQARRIMLRPLSLQESLVLVEQLANPIFKTATDSLVFQVGGIPANLLELGRALSITPQGSFSGSLASLLQARLDMLSSQARQMLACAALCGERSWEKLILELNHLESPSVLNELLNGNILIKQVSSSIPEEPEFRFQSELLRQAVLKMIPFNDRPLLHIRIASWLERYAPLSLSELIGHHFKEGRSPEAAYPHYLTAADLAAQEQDFEHAHGLYKELLELEVEAPLLAQAALAYAQAALSSCQKELALEQLTNADQWVELSPEDSRAELRRVYEQLYHDIAEA